MVCRPNNCSHERVNFAPSAHESPTFVAIKNLDIRFKLKLLILYSDVITTVTVNRDFAFILNYHGI